MLDKLKFILVMAIFGTVGLFVRNIDLEPGEISFYRCVIAMVIITTIVLVKRRGDWRVPLHGQWILILASGFVLGLNWMFLFAAYKYTTISNGVLCYYMAPVFVLILSPPILKEKVPLRKYIFVVTALVGMGFLVGANLRDMNGRHLTGIGFGILAAAFYAGLIILIKKIKKIPSLESTMFQFISAVITMFPYIYMTYGIRVFRAEARSVIWLLMLGVLHTGLCYISYFALLQKLKSDVIAIYSYMDPIVSILLSIVLLHDRLSALQIIGGILILGSTFLSEISGQGSKEFSS
ncbi:MAG: DMT family transporter [Fusobacteriaceae bacterium]|jgi:drug/metabolite transporter (DMT)-like permease|nr:DMT family transporter [Fusobacteriaceae bacterium]